VSHKNKITPWIPAMIWMVVIFYMSSQPAWESNSISKGITEQIIEILGRFISLDVETGTWDSMIPELNHYVRKAAHFAAYFILGIFVTFALIKNGFKLKSFYISFLFCLLFAISDEVHQLFVPGRGGMFKDVILDSLGSLTGIILYFLAKRLTGDRRKKRL